ncbi:MAG: hypothetical protein R3F61_29635 [Myxococcota bacterium]
MPDPPPPAVPVPELSPWLQKRLRAGEGSVVVELGVSRASVLIGVVMVSTLVFGFLAIVAAALFALFVPMLGVPAFIVSIALASVAVAFLVQPFNRSQRLTLEPSGLTFRTGWRRIEREEPWSGLSVDIAGDRLVLEGRARHVLALGSVPPGTAAAVADLLRAMVVAPEATLERLSADAGAQGLDRYAHPTGDGMHFDLSPVQRPLPMGVVLALPPIAALGTLVSGWSLLERGPDPVLLTPFVLIVLGSLVPVIQELRGRRPERIELVIDAARLRVVRTHGFGRRTEWACALSTVERITRARKTIRVHTSVGVHDIVLSERSDATIEAMLERIQHRLAHGADASRPTEVPDTLARLAQDSTTRDTR